MTENQERKQAMVAELARLSKSNGGKITPQALVEAARLPESPLHAHFEWDDGTAAEKYRLMQARDLLRSIKLKTVIEDRKVRIPAYIRDPEQVDAGEPGYIETARLRTQEDLAHEALVSEFQRVRNALVRARQLAIYFGMTEEVDRLMEDLDYAGSRLREMAPARAD